MFPHSRTTASQRHRRVSSSCACRRTLAKPSWPSGCATPSTTAAPSTWTTICCPATWTTPRARTQTTDASSLVYIHIHTHTRAHTSPVVENSSQPLFKPVYVSMAQIFISPMSLSVLTEQEEVHFLMIFFSFSLLHVPFPGFLHGGLFICLNCV